MNSKSAASSNAHGQQKKEFQVRIPKTTNKRLTILKFNESLNVRPQRWVMETLRMEREDNRRTGITNAGGFVQDFGEGSEYGKAAREEARLKKFGRQTRKYEHDKQPWRLTIEQNVAGDADGTAKVRKFRSMREAGASEHADYWIFYKSGNDLEAYKVDEWYQFLPAVTYKYLDAEQAEERFKERDNVLNHFALKAQIQKQLAEQEDQLQQQQRQKIGDSLKRSGALKIKDEASSDEDGEGDDYEEDEQNGKSKNVMKKKKEGKKGKKVKNEKEEKNKTKKQRVKAGDEIADYESEDGQDEGREYDYMSDSGSDSEREELNVDQKMDDDLVGVADEQGLKHDLDSDEDDDDFGEEEDDEEEEEEKKGQEEGKKNGGKEQNNETVDSRAKAVKNVDKMMEQNTGAKIRADFDNAEESDDSDFDEDPDSARVNSVLFMQDKRKPISSASSSQQRKRQEPGGTVETQQSSSNSEQPEAKRAKIAGDEPEFEAITESFIRKLLERRPHSTKQLLTKVNQRFQQQHKQDDNQTPPVKDKKIVAQLAEILKKIEPYQFRKKNEAGKDVLYFSMNRTA